MLKRVLASSLVVILAFVLLPIALFAGLLAVANRRATRAQGERERQSGDEE